MPRSTILPLTGCPKSNFNQPKKSKYQQKNQLTFNYSSKNEPFPLIPLKNDILSAQFTTISPIFSI